MKMMNIAMLLKWICKLYRNGEVYPKTWDLFSSAIPKEGFVVLETDLEDCTSKMGIGHSFGWTDGRDRPSFERGFPTSSADAPFISLQSRRRGTRKVVCSFFECPLNCHRLLSGTT
jgi:hypothetical protein